MELTMNTRYRLIAIIIVGILICGVYLFTAKPLSSPKISGTGMINITGGGQYILISDEGTVYYPLNPEEIHYPSGTRVYWEAVPADSADHSLGIPIRILMIAEYVPPLHIARINFTTNGK